jgi:AcrR family transcriptional regulator
MEPPADRRTELLDRITEALLAHGVGDLSLRPLAERVGTSARLLIYHFGSKEQLIAAALAEIRQQIAAALSARAAAIQPTSLQALLNMFWDWATEPAHARYFRLLFEIDSLAMFDRISVPDAAKRAGSDTWIEMIGRAAARLPEGGDRFAAHATLIMCALSGLLQEVLTTGDREPPTAALQSLIGLISADIAPPPASQGSGL